MVKNNYILRLSSIPGLVYLLLERSINTCLKLYWFRLTLYGTFYEQPLPFNGFRLTRHLEICVNPFSSINSASPSSGPLLISFTKVLSHPTFGTFYKYPLPSNIFRFTHNWGISTNTFYYPAIFKF
jgi:hypothetical protein